MDKTGFTWYQRFSMYVIYFLTISPLLHLLGMLVLGWPSAGELRYNPPKDFPFTMYRVIMFAVPLLAVLLTEKYSRGIFRYAIKKL